MMKVMNIVTLQVTCADEEEAIVVSNAILNAKLAACVKRQPVTSAFWWDGKIDNSSEVLLIIETVAEKFDAIESKIKEMHSYDTFVLLEYPVSRASAGVEQWLKENIDAN
jgi:periplasmic divalent cation tolerance protein